MARIHEKKLASGRVVWELTHGSGKDRIRFVAGDTKEQARATLALFKRQLATHDAPPEHITVAEAHDAYEAYLSVNRSPATVRRYLRVLATFVHCFLPQFHRDVTLLRQVKRHHLEEYKRRRLAGEIEESRAALVARADREARLRRALESQDELTSPKDNAKYGKLGGRRLKRDVTKKTINYELRVLGTFFRWAIKENYLFLNPAETVERFRVPKKSLPKFMTTEELRRFFSACDSWERRVFSIMLLSGMRRGELEHLEWEDVRVDLGLILIRAKEDWQPKTNERVIPISPELHQILTDHYDKRRSDRWVVANRNGNPETHLLEKLKKVCRRARVTPAATTLHALRHSFGAHLRMAGVPLASIADLMGHADLATTQVYAKVQVEHLRDAVSQLAPLVGREMSPENVTRGASGAGSPAKLLKSGQLEAGNPAWLGRRDSNPDSAVQSRMSCH